MRSEQTPYFAVGGTLRPDDPSYLERDADRLLGQLLLAGELCYVLDSRQKGKSSLIVRTLERLKVNGVTTLNLDLQRIGSNVNCEQWYAGLLHSIGQDLGLTEKLFAYWKSHLAEGPMIRWFRCIEAVVLEEIESPVVIFIDEVDFLMSLTFPTDEFFAGIRGTYNRRSTSPNLRRLTFCLAGVATPSQLIRNQDVTPFNIGRRVDLSDFSLEDLKPYIQRLEAPGRSGVDILSRIYWWTNGHPYLTQVLAAACAMDPVTKHPWDVDGVVKRILLDPDARQNDTNISDAERRLLEVKGFESSPDEARSRVLELYRLLLRGNVVTTNHDPAIIDTLLLSGVVTEQGRSLRIRNRIYEKAFDEAWCRNNLPILEEQRQRSAAIQSAWRIGRVAILAVSLLIAIVSYLLILTGQRDQALVRARQLNTENRRIAYQASIALASERVEDANFIKAFELVKSQTNAPDRGWEWRFWSTRFGEAKVIRPPDLDPKKLHQAFRAWYEGGKLVTLVGPQVFQGDEKIGVLNSGVAIEWLRATSGKSNLRNRIDAANKRFLAIDGQHFNMSEDGSVSVSWDPKQNGFDLIDHATGTPTHIETGFPPVGCYFSHNGRFVVAASIDNKTNMYNIAAKRWQWRQKLSQVARPVFSPNDEFIVLMQVSPDATVLKTVDGSLASRLKGTSGPIVDAHWFRDNTRIVTGSSDGTAKLWNALDGSLERTFMGATADVTTVDLNEDETKLIAMTLDSGVLEWRVDSQPFTETIDLHCGKITAMKMSPDGSTCVTSAIGGVSVLFDAQTGRQLGRYDLGANVAVHPMAYSAESKWLVLVTTNGSVVIVDTMSGKVVRSLQLAGLHPTCVTLTSRGQVLFGLKDGGLIQMPSLASTPSAVILPNFVITTIGISPDSNKAALATKAGSLLLLDLASLTGKVVHQEKGALSDAEFSPDGRWLACSSHGFLVTLLAVDDSTTKRILEGHRGRVWGVHFSPDSKRLVSNSYDNTARVWDVDSGTQVFAVQHGSWVSSSQWSPDGKRIITASADNFARICDPRDGFELMKLSGHQDIVFDAIMTPDGKSILTDCGDGKIRIWRTEQR